MQIVSQGLKFVYNKKTEFSREALKGIDLTIDEGDFYGIIGQTGSGKSTFIQHLNGLIRVQEGTLKVGEYDLSSGVKVSKQDLRTLRSKVGMVFQYPEYQLFAETVFEDVAFGVKNYHPEYTKEQIERCVWQAITSVGLDYDEVKNKSPFDLSGGQKRRVAIAGVLVTSPEILILDEPVAGLDPAMKKQLMNILHQIHKKDIKTIIIVSHDMDEVGENCNKIAVFSDGVVTRECSPRELFKDPSYLYSLRLDVPLVAKLTDKLRKEGIDIDFSLTPDEFVNNFLEKYNKVK